MKKNFAARAATFAVALSVIAGLTACGEERTLNPDIYENESQYVKYADDGTLLEITKPEKIKLVTDTCLTVENGRELFVQRYEELTGIDLDLEQPAHNQYYEKINLSFAGGEMPDVMEVGNTYYPNYANYGALFDLTDIWEVSDLKNGRMKDWNGDVVTIDEKYVDALKITSDKNKDGIITEDEKDRLYGFPMTRGNGTVTYVRGDWIKELGDAGKLGYNHKDDTFTYKGEEIDFSDDYMEQFGEYMEYMPQNYDEFLSMLRAFKDKRNDIIPLTAAGLINSEAPYDIYLREFYQDARPDFYIPEGGDKYVDGMSEPQMIDALQRMQDAFKEGLMDREIITNQTSTARNKFYEDKVGCFNYWSGMWCQNLNRDLKKQNPDGVAVPMPPLVETEYIERPPTALAVTTAAENPWGIYKYVCELSHDGADGQMLFSRGVEGELIKDGDKVKEVTGHFKWIEKNKTAEALPSIQTPDSTEVVEKSWYSPELSITSFPDPVYIKPIITSSLDMFGKTSRVNPVPKMTLNIADAMTEITTIRQEVIAKVVKGEMTPQEGVKDYETRAALEIETMMKELNGASEETEAE